jgi:imidazolonepropionase-like amidohydrolase
VLKEKAALNFSFDKGTSTQDYPTSLMGSIALIRQTFLDAQWYQDGGYKKEFNISLDAFNQKQDLPQVIEVSEKQDELRASRLGKEFGKKFIIKGKGDEFERLNEIKETGNALIVPVSFPEAYDVSDPWEAINIPLRLMKQWELAPYNAAGLAKAGIDFALTTADLKNKTDFMKNLRRAIECGLSPEDAIRALTSTPARLIGVSDKVGRLSKGMMANFFITNKPVFDKESVILENWVNGVPYRYHDPAERDMRGNYSLRIGEQKPVRLKIGGEMYALEAFIYEDTAGSKVILNIPDKSFSLQFELKKTDPKGIYRLTGRYDDSLRLLSGKVQLPSGTWADWLARFDSAFVPPPVKKDTAKKQEPGKVFYPDMAFGWTELPTAKPFVIRNATVWTNEKEGILTNADVYVTDGKIKQVGKNLAVPPGTVSVDGTNRHVTSGIIDEHSHIAVSGAVNEASEASSAEVRIGDVVDADDIQIYRQLAGGVTVSHILHGSANPIGGQTQLIKLRWGRSPESMKFENAPRFIKFALGENVKQSHWGDKQVIRFPQTRMGVEQVYIDYFTRAREYAQQRKKYLSADSKMRTTMMPVRQQLELDAISDILDKKLFITCHSYEQSEINMLMHVADSFGFRVNTFTHILEGYKVADKMKAHGVSGVSSFADWWAYKFEVYEAIPYNGAILHKMGLNVSFNSDDPEMARRLNQEAAKAVKYGGVKEEEAWKFVTLNPAKMLRVDDRVGSILPGKDADLVVWNENPLSVYAYPLQTYVDGIRYFDIDTDRELRKQVTAERQRLMQKMAEAKAKGEDTKKPGMGRQEIHRCEGSEYLLFNKTDE